MLDKANHPNAPKEESPFIEPDILSARDFRDEDPPEREWKVPGWMPANDVSMLGADGGGGKTQLGLQLGIACETGSLWLGKEVIAGSSMLISAEEPRDELHIRYRMAAKPVLYQPEHEFYMISMADREDAALVAIGPSSKPEPTPLFNWLEGIIHQLGIKLLILDAVADVCAINENSRNDVRRAVAILRGLAIRQKCAILLLAHPSVDGMKTGRGYSGSTHWNNAVRSRMYMTTPEAAEGDEIDPDARILSLEKANRARKGQKIILRWSDGRFVEDTTNSIESVATVVRGKELFIRILKTLSGQKRGNVSANPAAKNYAPRVFEKHPDADGIKVKIFERAMEELFSEEMIEIFEDGPPSKRREYIVLSGKYYVAG